MYKLLSVFAIVFGTLTLFSGCSETKKEKDEYSSDVRSPKDSRSKDTVQYERFGMIDLSATRDKNALLCQLWENGEDLDDAPLEESETVELVSRGFSFSKDGKMIKDPRGEFTTGEWKLDETKQPALLTAKYSNGTSVVYNLVKLTSKKMLLQKQDGKEVVEYRAQGIGFVDENLDPFSLINNQWRMKPSRAESEEALRKRLKDNIHFFVMFYDFQLNSASATIRFTGLPTCFRWYAGGIFLQKTENLSQKWVNCFFNKQQAMQAYVMAEKLLEQKYTWPKGERNWARQNVFVLKQMEKNL